MKLVLGKGIAVSIYLFAFLVLVLVPYLDLFEDHYFHLLVRHFHYDRHDDHHDWDFDSSVVLSRPLHDHQHQIFALSSRCPIKGHQIVRSVVLEKEMHAKGLVLDLVFCLDWLVEDSKLLVEGSVLV
jgi:hypothetical protein